MNQVHLFGSSNPTGNELKKILKANSKKLNIYGRNSNSEYIFNLNNLENFSFANLKEDSSIISLLQIWHFAYFLNFLYKNKKNDLENIKKIIVVSSSSVITKKFAFNKFDRLLVQKLIFAENEIINISRNLEIKLTIIRPTLIYGESDSFKDKNVSVLTTYLKICPCIFIPKNSGLRQPIHCDQLAKLIYKLNNDWQDRANKNNFVFLNVGGDDEISYSEMLERIYLNLVNKKVFKNIIYFHLPYNIFAFLISPLLLIRPKLFEALLRINTDLSDFEKVSEILNEEPQKFPLNNQSD